MSTAAPLDPRRWPATALLCLLFAFSYVDRLILGLLTIDIGRDLSSSDTQLGVVIGTVFAVTYSLAGIPIAHLLDRANRKRIIVAGALFWGVMTMLSGLAPNLAILALCRAGLAAGEAVLTPGAISMIADLFPRERRVLPVAIYTSVISLMAVGGLIVGAAGLEVARHLAPMLDMPPWRVVLLLAGLPPLLLAALFAAVVAEPARGRYDDPVAAGETTPDFAAVLRHLRGEWRFYLPFYVGSALVAIFLLAMMTWAPALLIRGHGMDTRAVGFSFGTAGMVGGLVGAVVWPRLVVVLRRRGSREPVLLGAAVACLLGAPFMTAGSLAPSATLVIAGLGLGLVFGAAIAVLVPLAVQTYGPPAMRARLMAIVALAQNLIGYGVGPALAAALALFWAGERLAIGYALALLAAVLLPLSALCYAIAHRRVPIPDRSGSRGSR